LGNPAYFLQQQLGLNGFYTTVSTACSSGLKAFIIAQDLIRNNVVDAIILGCVDSLAKIPIYGFHSLEVLSKEPSIPLSKNRSGMNIGEACAVFITEKDSERGIDIMGLGESSDVYHSTTPDPEAKESICAIKKALTEAKITPSEVDYINLHGTGTIANDIMETNAIYKVFSNKVPVSSTKPLTGHCLGAAAGIETALCCKLLDNFKGELYPHIYDNEYDTSLPMVNIVRKNQKYSKCDICMCNSFGFGGANAIMVLGRNK
jgi:3-oxoacyl-[acyl-carrier-protein] synthase-1